MLKEFRPTQKWDVEHIHAIADLKGAIQAQDDITNLALLDKITNTEYKNKPFDEKRKIIRDKASDGRFIPLGTQNVFFKVYTDNPNEADANKWADPDQEGYAEEIKTIFKNYFLTELAPQKVVLGKAGQ